MKFCLNHAWHTRELSHTFSFHLSKLALQGNFNLGHPCDSEQQQQEFVPLCSSFCCGIAACTVCSCNNANKDA